MWIEFCHKLFGQSWGKEACLYRLSAPSPDTQEISESTRLLLVYGHAEYSHNVEWMRMSQEHGSAFWTEWPAMSCETMLVSSGLI
jgi:hypothetical protein